MCPVQWTESAGQPESLALCLRALLAGGAGEPPDYAELVATLGLGSALVAVSDECLGWWWTYARDLCLRPAAELYGLRLRELHPPEAASGLRHSPEYARHFADSYLPLIREALAHQQPVLAWRGWPRPSDRYWGVIVAGDGDRLAGYTLGCAGNPVSLAGPVHQVYVVEECRPPPRETRAAAAALFEQSCRATRAFWTTAPSPGPDTEVGARACARLCEAVASLPACPLCGGRSYRCVARAAGVLRAARREQAAWLERIAPALDAESRTKAERWAAGSRSAAAVLEPFASAEALKPLLETPLGREQLAGAIAEAGRIEAQLAGSLAAED